MDKKLYETVKNYKITLALIKEMLSSGIITEKDFGIICLILAEKYDLNSCSIFAEIDLITARTDSNI